MNRINILQLLPTFNEVSGPSTVVWALVTSLDTAKYNIVICSMRAADPVSLTKAQEHGIQVAKLNMHSLSDVRALFRLGKVLQDRQIDILHNHGFRPRVYGGVAGQLLGRRIIVSSVHENMLYTYSLHYGGITARLSIAALNCIARTCEDALVGVSQEACDALIAVGAPHRKVSVIHNGIDPTLFQFSDADKSVLRKQILSELGVPLDAFVVGTIGTLNRRKNHAFLVLAIPLILAQVPKAKFLFVGSEGCDPTEHELRAQMEELNVADAVLFCGPRNDVPQLLQALDLMVLPSLAEGLPMVILEAMAAKVPVVATAVSGIPEMIENGISGILVDPKDVNGLAQAIIRVRREDGLAAELGRQGYNRLCRNFTASVMALKHQNLYERLLCDKGLLHNPT